MAIDLTAPQGVRAALRRGLRLHEEGRSGDGLKPETVAWARRLANGEAASEAKVRDMSAWHKRHKASRSPGWDERGKEKPGFVAYLLWGGAPGERWADRKVEEMDRKDADGPTRAVTRAIARKVRPEALVRGEPLIVLRVGIVRDFDGRELDGNVTSRTELEEMVRFFDKAQKPTGELPLIDMNHAAVGPLSFMAHPEATIPVGAVLEMRVVDDDIGAALEVVPGYTKRGRDIIEAAEGLLYVSATYRLGPTTDRMNPEPVADAALLAFALTPTPATRIDQLGEVRTLQPAGIVPAKEVLVEDYETEVEGMEPEAEDGGEMTPEQKEARIAELEAELAKLKGEPAEKRGEPEPGVAATAFADRLVDERAINPADRRVWAVRYEIDAAKAMQEAPKSGSAYRQAVGSAEKPKAEPRWRNATQAMAHARQLSSEKGMSLQEATARLCETDPLFNKLVTGGVR